MRLIYEIFQVDSIYSLISNEFEFFIINSSFNRKEIYYPLVKENCNIKGFRILINEFINILIFLNLEID